MKTKWQNVILLLLAAWCIAPGTNKESTIPAGNINFPDIEVVQVLDVYQVLTGRELVIASNVRTNRASIKLISTQEWTKTQAIDAFNKAFLEQAGIVMTDLDGNRTSVTYNDALPIKKSAK